MDQTQLLSFNCFSQNFNCC